MIASRSAAQLRRQSREAAEREAEEDARLGPCVTRRDRWGSRFRYREPRSLIPSSWPALEESMRRWVTPGFYIGKDLRMF